MTKPYDNSWLLETGIGSHESNMWRVLRAAEKHCSTIIENMKHFDGTKVVIPCTPATSLLPAIKQSLCLADLVILVPAPLWVSCHYDVLAPYSEFNEDSMGSFAHCGLSVAHRIEELLSSEARSVKSGALTFLPIIGESAHRWHPAMFGIPDLPRPYSSHFGEFTQDDIHREALYNLTMERMVVGSLGASHVNGLSARVPLIGDAALCDTLEPAGVSRQFLPIDIPDLRALSVGDILSVKRELHESYHAFGRIIDQSFQRYRAAGLSGEEAVQKLSADISEMSSDLMRRTAELVRHSSCLAAKVVAKSAIMVLSTAGVLGDMSSTWKFLIGGGSLWDLYDIAQCAKQYRLQVRSNSLFYIARLRARAARRKAKKG